MTIFTSAIARYLYNFNKSHPLKNGKGVLVDYNVASLMLPMIVLGASIGVMLNKILPSYIIASLLTILLIYVCFTTFKKIMTIVRMERKKFGPVCARTKKP